MKPKISLTGKTNLWSTEEDAVLKAHFFDTPFSSHETSRFVLLRKLLQEKGYDRTNMAISRRCTRLGLRSITINNKKVEVKCCVCGETYLKAERYVKRDPRHRCPKCQRINNGYSSLEKKKEYARNYMKKWSKLD